MTSFLEKAMRETVNSRSKLCRNLVLILLLIDLYCVSFFILAKPCKNINRAPYDLGFGSSKLPPAVGGTALCVSECSEVNKIAYWCYWPVHTFLEWRYVAWFAYDPAKEF